MYHSRTNLEQLHKVRSDIITTVMATGTTPDSYVIEYLVMSLTRIILSYFQLNTIIIVPFVSFVTM